MEPRWMRCNQCDIEIVSVSNVCPRHTGHMMVPTGKPVEAADLPVAPPEPNPEEDQPVTTRETELEPGGGEPAGQPEEPPAEPEEKPAEEE